MSDARVFMRLHLEALFTLDRLGRLLGANDASAAPAPRFFMGRTLDGNVWAVRHDVPKVLASQLNARAAEMPAGLDAGAPPEQLQPFLGTLASHQPVTKTWVGPNYSFPHHLPCSEGTVIVTSTNASVLSPHLEEWLEDVAQAVPMTAYVDSGHAVAVCASVRVSARAHEAGVETHPEFRGRGHGSRVVAAWAEHVRGIGLIPLYSTSWENVPSRRVAAKLGLIHYGSVFHIT